MEKMRPTRSLASIDIGKDLELSDEELAYLQTQKALKDALAEQKVFDQTTIDYSFDNRVLNKILHAKFIFLYEEARRRNTKSSSSSSVITR